MHEPLNNITYAGKKMSFNFLGANFVVPKSGHKQSALGRALECTAKIKMKNTRPKKLVRDSYQIFYFLLCYILVFTSADTFSINFQNFIQHYLKKKIFFSTDLLKIPPTPLTAKIY